MNRIVVKIIRKLTTIIFKVLSLKVNKKLVYFESFHAKQFSDNPKAIYEYLKEHHPEYQLVWGVKKGYEEDFAKHHIPHVTRFKLNWYLTMPRAKYWVINTRTPSWIPKSKNNVYIQTWHGTPLKKLGRDIEDVKMPGTTTEKYQENFKKESSRWDYFVVPNTFSKNVLERAFSYNGQTIDKGYPRTDYLMTHKNNKDEIVKLKQKLNIDVTKKVILYAPTWRDNQYFKVGSYKFNEGFSMDAFDKKFGEDAVLVLRMHYLVAEKLDLSRFNGRVINMSNYEDINHLLLISDILITDYSSLFVEYAILDRPMYFYMYDRVEYEGEIRGFYNELYKELPGKIVEEETILFNELEKQMADQEEVKHDEFNKKYNKDNDGHVAQKIWSQIKK